MGGCVDVHADPKRHLSPGKYTMEAFIDRNGPPLSQADRLLVEALDSYFKEHCSSRGGAWHFHTKPSAKSCDISLVCAGEERQVAKFPFIK